jgi:hypothetical protein
VGRTWLLWILTLYHNTAGWLLSTELKGKGKAIPIQALTDPDVSRRLRLSDFKTVGT